MVSFPIAQRVDVGEVSLEVYEAGPSEAMPIVLCHGFPETAFSWRHQFPVLVEAGFRVLAPNQRGYAGSDRPSKIEDYDLVHLARDLVGLLDAKEISRAVFVGHDWGGFVTWTMPLLYPERCLGCVGVNTPYMSLPTTEQFKLLFSDPEQFYILWFQEPGIAEKVLEKNKRKLFEVLMTKGSDSAVSSWSDANPFRSIEEVVPSGAAILSEEEIQRYVKDFDRSGFEGPLNWYRNLDRNQQLLPEVGQASLRLPVLMVTAEWDRALPPALANGMAALCKDLERVDLLECGHWTQQEKPNEFNQVLLDWLCRRFGPAGERS